MPKTVRKSPEASPASKAKPIRKRAKTASLSIAYPNACGIDIGATSHFVAVPADRDAEPVQEFAALTADLERLVRWLRQCAITAVAMESTGVYWIPLFEMLDAAGFEVHLVNARHVRSVPGRKSDVLDCQWLQQLMSYGLLRGGFRPPEEGCALRAIWRHRDMLLSYQARHVQHLQKAMTQMNVQLHHVISDIMGVTGQAIIRAIVAGERNAATLAKLRDRRIKADEAEVAAALQGHWRDEHLFALKQALALIDSYAAQITECDGKLQQLLSKLKGHELPEDGLGAPKRSTPAKNSVGFDARGALFEASGVDLTRIPGIDTSTALKVISEIGVDLARFPSVKHFTSWLGLCPGTKISGGQGAFECHQALRQPRRPGLAHGRAGAAQKSNRTGRASPPTVLTHGQTQGHHRQRTQAGAAGVFHAHQRASLCRGRTG